MLGVEALNHLQAACSPEPRGGVLGSNHEPIPPSIPCPGPGAASQRNCPLSLRKLGGPQNWPTRACGCRDLGITVPQNKGLAYPLSATQQDKDNKAVGVGSLDMTRPGFKSRPHYL